VRRRKLRKIPRPTGSLCRKPFRFRTARVPIVCRLSDSRQRLSLGNCHRMPFSFAGLAVSSPTECRTRYRAGRVGESREVVVS
jgi:hypothetical protein